MIQSIIALLLIILFDKIWFSLNGKIYYQTINDVQGSPLKINLYGAAFSYIFIFLGLSLIVFRSINQDKTTKNKFKLALKHGALFGFIAYGIYNATNVAIFSSYSKLVATVDTIWGGITFFLAVIITLFISDSHLKL